MLPFVDTLVEASGLSRVRDMSATDTFPTLNARTGEVLAEVPIDDEAAVGAAVARAREAAEWWSASSYDERAEVLLAWKRLITDRLLELADLMHRENGKPHSDAVLEAGLAVDHLDWAAKHAEGVLKRRRRPSGMTGANMTATVEYHPLGVIGVIGPWNYPVFTPMGSIAYALAAGNAVVFKPSEHTPLIGKWLADTFAEVCARPVFQVVTGLGPTGNALCLADVDKVAFTGSTATGKKVMAACAENLTPVLIEAGGKDALIVDDDADVEAAADAAVWGACSNAGQTCAGVERVYVHERVYDRFVDSVVAKTRELHAEGKVDDPMGPITMPKQIDIIRDHIDDAIARGGRALVGGPEAVGERFVQPTVLVDVPEDSRAVQEETFGPTMTIRKVADMEEAIRLTNDNRFALGSTVFSASRGLELAQRIRSGMTAVNSVLSFAAVPSLPFGGVGDSGFGRIHGPDGLKEFTYAKAIAKRRFTTPLELTTFARSDKQDNQFLSLLRMMHGSKAGRKAARRKAGH